MGRSSRPPAPLPRRPRAPRKPDHSAVCHGCYRELGECGCCNVPLPRPAPAQMAAELHARWRAGAPTIPELRWVVSWALDVPLSDVTIHRQAHDTTVVVNATLCATEWDRLDRIERLAQGGGSALGRLRFSDASRARTG